MIVTSTETLRKYIAVNADLEFASLAPYVRIAEQKYILPAIGKQLYDIVNNGVVSNNIDGFYQELLPYLEAVITSFAVLAYVPTGNILITDNGILMSTEDNAKPAPLWAKEELQDSLKNSGFADLEALFEYLTDNADHFPEWTVTDSYKRFKGHFINRTIEFSDIYDINCSYRTFTRLKSIISNIEEDIFKDLLGSEYYNYLLESILDRDINIDDKPVIKKIQKALVYLTIAEACDSLPVEFSDEGLVVKSTDSYSINKISRPALTSELVSKKNSANKKAEQYLSELKTYLNSTASSTVLPIYFNSSAYTDPSTIKVSNDSINDSDSKIILL